MNVLAVAVMLAATAGAGSALAATAHNSQAGSFGPNKHTCEPTPYFQAGGCLTSFFTGQDDGWVEPRTERYRERYQERRPLRPLDR
ncbi:hypothetical protein D3272_14500 [Lichenibacterium ramalinae]|uniref:DUF3551 domain-containing protein n=2 Tax=Lichenibacterium ramalinae TaxID=2316527 RepID=A0A4Q2RD72_9HYPH|nr:hypothetical protein D3272_14500 [Lichenibacterium ramalinae]